MESKKKTEGEEAVLQDHWYLVDMHGQKFRLPKTMLFLGREECDVVVASQSVDKRHAVLTFDLYLNRFKVKDLSTTNGTYVNNSRIPEQEYVTLNHMDSVRLGHDAMMYHMEQGSQISSQGGQIPDPHFIPSWATRHSQDPAAILHTHAMAECQGCIAEQNIEHTCSLKHESRPGEDLIEISDSEHHVCHHPHHKHHHYHPHLPHDQHHQPEFQDYHAPHSPKTAQTHQDYPGSHHRHPHSSDQPPEEQQQHQDIPSDASQDQIHTDEDQANNDEEASEDLSDAPGTGRNTWPRKRHMRQTAHVKTLFDADSSPDHTASEARPAGAAPAMYFVSFDDSVCNASSSKPPAEARRRQRSSRNLGSAELATVKKGTPLYGQPAWWGEDADEGQGSADSSSKPNGDKKSARKTSRPSNLELDEGKAAMATSDRKSSKSDSTEGEQLKPHAGPTYMEIPLKDDDDSPEGGDKSKDTLTPAKSISSSLSKDSLSASPEIKQPSKSAKTQSPGADINSATSFTIDLDEDHPKKSLNISSSLSAFVPPKIMKNFRERKDRLHTGSKESTPSKNSEERELSPLHQRKIDEIWSTVVEGKGKSSRLSSAQATAGTSLRSPNLEEIDRWSELSEERRSSERESDKKGAMKKPPPSKSPLVSKSLSSKLKPASATTTSASKSPLTTAANLSQFPDPTSYLINKMFEGGTTASASSDKEVSPEQKLYTEAASHDKPLATRRSNDKSVVRHVIDEPTAIYGATTGGSKKPTKLEKHDDEEEDDEEDDDLRITEDIQDDDIDIEPKDEDKASESGTYTIESDLKEGQEEEEARKRIDQVFGVDVEDFTADNPSIDPLRLASPGGYDNVYDDADGDGDKTPLDENARSPVDDYDDDDDLILDDDYDHEEDSEMAATDGVQAWVSQLTALTSQKGSGDGARENGDASLSKKPPQGLSRKRPGTGRKLPSIPTDKSPVSSEHSSYVGDHDLSIGDDLPSARTSELMANGGSSNGKPARISSQTRSRTGSKKNGYKEDGASPSTSARSRGSVDTELLLQDTQTVMAAMEARMAYRTSHDNRNSYSVDSDTDVSSTVALVNGDEDYVKPTLHKSPREAMSKRQQRDNATKPVSSNAASTPPASASKKAAGRSYSQTVASKSKAAASPRSTPRSTPSAGATKKSAVSDVFSRSDSIDNDSIMSDVSSDMGDGNLSRSSSKGKGNITMTKPNRAFQLRRARADSLDEPTTPRSTKSVASAKSGASSSSARSSSVHSSTRNRSQADTNRSEATSLGAQIVKKSQSNSAQDKARRSSAGVARTDNGRQNQRLQRASSLTITQAPAPRNDKRESTPKLHLRSTPTGKGSLSISGINSSFSSRSQSQPGSRSNSPKAAERMAWKRRKEYDARKSVAEAKAKTKDGSSSGVTMRPKPSASSSIKRRMIRSASFTNSGGLALGIHESVSGSQDFVDRRGQHEQDDFRRAFLPFQNSLRTDRSTHSADEDDSLVSATSAQVSSRSMVSLTVTPEPKSAFTPPLLRTKAISPGDSPSPQALSLRRKTSNLEGDSGQPKAPTQTNGDAADSGLSSVESPPQTSYDSLIVSSIYQLTLKLKTTTDKTLNKLRDQNRVSHTPSPIDDFLSDSGKSEITAWKSANQELAVILKNLRKLERHVQMMNTVLFPEDEMNSDVSSGLPTGRQGKQRYYQEIERIRNELAGFHPIDHPRPDEHDVASPEMDELMKEF